MIIDKIHMALEFTTHKSKHATIIILFLSHIYTPGSHVLHMSCHTCTFLECWCTCMHSERLNFWRKRGAAVIVWTMEEDEAREFQKTVKLPVMVDLLPLEDTGTQVNGVPAVNLTD